jgi:hypothetical protein
VPSTLATYTRWRPPDTRVKATLPPSGETLGRVSLRFLTPSGAWFGPSAVMVVSVCSRTNRMFEPSAV